VLSQVLPVASFLKQKFKKFMETLAGHLKSAGTVWAISIIGSARHQHNQQKNRFTPSYLSYNEYNDSTLSTLAVGR